LSSNRSAASGPIASIFTTKHRVDPNVPIEEVAGTVESGLCAAPVYDVRR
jgi:hypothetical protein